MLRKTLPIVLALPLVFVLGPGRVMSQPGGGYWRGSGPRNWRNGPPQIAVTGSSTTTTPTQPPSRPTPPTAQPAQQTPEQGNNRGGRSLRFFQALDKNGDGLLSVEEMPDALRAELAQWDENHDNFIDQNEFAKFYQAYRDRQRQAAATQGYQPQMFSRPMPTWIAPGRGVPVPVVPQRQEEKKLVYHFDNLPKNIPAWFKQLDTDQDGQISFAEWREAKRPDDEFFHYDRNGDGFLTVEEVLWDESHGVIAADNKGTPTPAGSPGGMGSRYSRARQ